MSTIVTFSKHSTNDHIIFPIDERGMTLVDVNYLEALLLEVGYIRADVDA